MPDFDMAVIGAGAAGLSVTYAATQLGLNVALIERDRMGGDCLNVGCVPSKALLAAAYAAETARTAARLGIGLPAPAVDWAGVQRHVHGAIATIAPTDSEARYTGLGATVLRANARFTGPASLAVDGRTLKARRIVIATGSRARVPDLPGLAEMPYLTHDNLFDLPERPDHLLIIGGPSLFMSGMPDGSLPKPNAPTSTWTSRASACHFDAASRALPASSAMLGGASERAAEPSHTRATSARASWRIVDRS